MCVREKGRREAARARHALQIGGLADGGKGKREGARAIACGGLACFSFADHLTSMCSASFMYVIWPCVRCMMFLSLSWKSMLSHTFLRGLLRFSSML